MWIGLLVALAFIETPLKFYAPGMTLPVALGLGRLVLTAAEIAGLVLLLAMTAASLPRPRLGRVSWWVLGGLWLVLLIQMVVIRPQLNARTDQVLAGEDSGSSSLHGIYIGADIVLLLGALIYVILAVRALPGPAGRR